MKNNKTILMITIISLMLVFTGITYAYFTAFNNEGSTAEISFGPGKMLIEYADKSDDLSLTKTIIQPSDTILIDKTFTLTGTNTATSDGGVTMPFTISLEYQNTFKYGNLKYFFKRMDENENIIVDLESSLEISKIDQDDIDKGKYPEELLNYYSSYMKDSSGETYTQEIASGYFKPSSEKQTVTFNLKMMFPDTGKNQDYNKGATFNGKIVVNESKDVMSLKFASDSWEEIAANVKAGKGDVYEVGSEKEVKIDGNSYTVRVANNTTPDECSGDNFSETACGFVVEFTTKIESRRMNETDTNAGGWPASELRTYANGEFFNKLPSDLQNVIIDTKVISGYGKYDSENFTSTDKIYLLSLHEMFENGSGYASIVKKDTSWDNTRQLDYYKNIGLKSENSYTFSNYILKNYFFWFRSALSESSTFASFDADWWLFLISSSQESGFSPAFRIG